MSTPNKYQPVAPAYWNGALTRAEAQKIFDEYGSAIQQQALAITKLDMCMAYLCEKFGVKPEDVETWAQEKVALAKFSCGQCRKPVHPKDAIADCETYFCSDACRNEFTKPKLIAQA